MRHQQQQRIAGVRFFDDDDENGTVRQCPYRLRYPWLHLVAAQPTSACWLAAAAANGAAGVVSQMQVPSPRVTSKVGWGWRFAFCEVRGRTKGQGRGEECKQKITRARASKAEGEDYDREGNG